MGSRTLDSARARRRRQAKERLGSLERERTHLLRLFPDLEPVARDPARVADQCRSWARRWAPGDGPPRPIDETN
jgi:hypothetical protein